MKRNSITAHMNRLGKQIAHDQKIEWAKQTEELKRIQREREERLAREAATEQPERFQLTSEPKPTFWKCPKQPKAKQTVLFSGLDLLPGQNDLFPTDGAPAQ